MGAPDLKRSMEMLTRRLFQGALVLASALLATTGHAAVVCSNCQMFQNGTAGADTFNGTAGMDCYDGLGGNDTIDGKGGDDCLLGGNGADYMQGADGNDE